VDEEEEQEEEDEEEEEVVVPQRRSRDRRRHSLPSGRRLRSGGAASTMVRMVCLCCCADVHAELACAKVRQEHGHAAACPEHQQIALGDELLARCAAVAGVWQDRDQPVLHTQKSPPEDDEEGGATGRRYPARDRNTLQRFNFDVLDSEPQAKRRRILDSDSKVLFPWTH